VPEGQKHVEYMYKLKDKVTGDMLAWYEDRKNCMSLKGMHRLDVYGWHLLRAIKEVWDENLKIEGTPEPEMSEGDDDVETRVEVKRHKEGIRRYLLTVAQNNTKVHAGFVQNLAAFAEHMDAEVMVSRCTYWGEEHERRQGKRSSKAGAGNRVTASWDPSIPEHWFCDQRVHLADGLMFYGDADIMPTAATPLSGRDGYGGSASGIFPHTKVAMKSIAMPSGTPVKMLYTTGALTRMNYVQRTAGQKAEFHHVFGALLVEVDADGRWFCRQIIADRNGDFQDLGVHANSGEVFSGHVHGAVFGDLHLPRHNLVALEASIRMAKVLVAEHVVLHDVLDIFAGSPHELDNHSLRYHRALLDQDDVGHELSICRNELVYIQEQVNPTPIHIVNSNHDDHLTRWLDQFDYKKDIRNAPTWFKMQANRYRHVRDGAPEPFLQEALDWSGASFLGEDESLVLAGVECGMHGHRGANGSRGTLAGFARMGVRSIVGHSHSAGIQDGAYQVGTLSRLRLGYNKGPSSWSHTNALIYPNGKRTLITIKDGRWRAE